MSSPRTRLIALVCALCTLLAACTGGDTAGGGDSDGTGGGDAGGRGPSADVATSSAPLDAGGAARGVEQVTFASGDLTLAGDLYLPEGSGSHPGVVLIHGSGPQDRDERVSGQLGMTFPQPVTVFADIAGALRAAGYAVLTYDKRTCGPTNGCADNGYPAAAAGTTVDDFVADATAAVAHLRSRAEVRPDAVAVAGHSQGASLVPAILIDDPRLAAGVMLSASYDPIDKVLAAQHPESGARVTALRSEDVADSTMVMQASAAFWRSWLRLTDGVPQLASQAEQPLLVLGGALDSNVPPAQLAKWRRTLTGDADRVVMLDCLTHALNCLATDDMERIVPADVGQQVDPRVAETMAAFLDRAVD